MMLKCINTLKALNRECYCFKDSKESYDKFGRLRLTKFILQQNQVCWIFLKIPIHSAAGGLIFETFSISFYAHGNPTHSREQSKEPNDGPAQS